MLHHRRAQPRGAERIYLRISDGIGKRRFRVGRYGLYLVAARKVCRMLGIHRPELEERFHAITRAHIK